MVGLDVPQPFLSPVCKAAPYPLDLVATAACLHFGHLLRRRASHHLRVGVLVRSCFKKLAPLSHVFRLKDKWCQRFLQFKGLDYLELSTGDLTSSCSTSFSFFNEGRHGGRIGNAGMSNSKMSGKDPFNGRKWTEILLAANVLFYIAQLATQGKLLLWGAKPMIFLTSKYSNSIISRKSGSATSYWFCRMPAVGASGAIFGLVGSVAVFVLRHKDLVGGGKEHLQHIAQVIALNMVIGLLSNGIDNWGHLGGFVGGVAASWLIGPAWKYESTSRDGRRLFTDTAPMYNLFKIKRVPKQWK
ncbi:RHOMBOID protein 10 [Spatholobus suberectus]|nr:RHOMBOID protein 10 [Spatholobus suberectus]